MKRLIRIIPIVALLFAGISRIWWRSIAAVAARPVPGQQASTLTTQYVYDNNGRLAAVVNQDGTAVEYSYDPAGNITSISVPALRVVSYSPSSGAAGTQVTFTGIGLPKVTSVTFAATPASFSITSPNLVAVVPSGVVTATTQVNVTLTSPQTSVTVPFTILIGS